MATTALKPKNSERLRRNWRTSAKKRRDAEAEVFRDLERSLPVPRTLLKTMDKVALLRIVTNYVRVRELLAQLHVQTQTPSCSSFDMISLLRDEFVVVLATNGEIVYASDGAAAELRQEKYKVIGTNIYDLIQSADWIEMDRLLSSSQRDLSAQESTCDGDGDDESNEGVFKSARASALFHLNGRRRLLQLTGTFFHLPSASYFVGVGVPPADIPYNPRALEFPHPHLQVLATTHSIATLDMKAVWLDPWGELITGYVTSDLVGVSCFELTHPEDTLRIRETVQKLHCSEETATGTSYGRMLFKGGGWAWFVTRAKKIRVQVGDSGSGGNAEQVTFFLAQHFMVSEVHERGAVLGLVQLRGAAAAAAPPTPTGQGAEEEFPSLEESPMDFDEQDLDELLRFIDQGHQIQSCC